MATSAESTFIAAVSKAESTRQVAKAAAFATWAYGTGSSLTTYTAALLAADQAYVTAVNSALNTLATCGVSVPNQGAGSQVPVISPATAGITGPIGGLTATFGGEA
jgi:hydroxymethylpyrimidine/phosphomethylpyrimidine kinase